MKKIGSILRILMRERRLRGVWFSEILVDSGSKMRAFLFTQEEVALARKRASKNGKGKVTDEFEGILFRRDTEKIVNLKVTIDPRKIPQPLTEEWEKPLKDLEKLPNVEVNW